MSVPKISIIVPAYDEVESLPLLHKRLQGVLRGKDCEIILIDDGSRDGTGQVMETIAGKDKHVRIISLRRRSGKSAALDAGFKAARGEMVITLDADLQDDPSEIPRFIDALDRFDLVVGWKVDRKDSIAKTLPSRIANALTNAMVRTRLHDMNCGFKAMSREVAKSLHLYGELHRFIPALAQWQGFTVGEIPVKHHARKYGKSKYGFSRLFSGFLDLITVKFLTDFGSRPLHFFGTIGLLCTAAGMLSGLYLTYEWLQGMHIGSRPLLMLSVLLVVLGVQFISIGLIGEMIVRNKNT